MKALLLNTASVGIMARFLLAPVIMAILLPVAALTLCLVEYASKCRRK